MLLTAMFFLPTTQCICISSVNLSAHMSVCLSVCLSIQLAHYVCMKKALALLPLGKTAPPLSLTTLQPCSKSVRKDNPVL